MDRLAAYIGPDIRLDQFLLAPTHGLLAQAFSFSDSLCAGFSTDGFGISWYTTDGIPAVYTNSRPIWSDINLPHLAHSLYSNLWLASVHNPTRPFSPTETQPLYDAELIFLHTGFFDNFSGLLRTIRDFLNPAIEAAVGSNTNSQYLFALLRHLLTEDAELSVEEALREMLDLLEGWMGGNSGLLNIVVSEGERIYATRHAINKECPALYYNIDDETFPDGQLVASAPLTESEFWQPVPEHHLLILDPEEPPELLTL